MANEITYHGKLAFDKDDADKFDFGELTATMAGTKALRGRQTCSTTPEALGLGEVSAAGAWFICRNRDATNKLLIRPGTGLDPLIEVRAGEVSGPFRFASTVTAPFAEASAATVEFTYLLVSA